MAMRNYRQAKRNREETRKKRKQEKLAQKQSRVAAPVADQDPLAPMPEITPKESQ
jgi:hypothetical protein